MAVENLIAVGAEVAAPRVSHGLGGNIKGWSRTVEVTAAATQASTYDFGYVPTGARILGISRVSWDDLTGAGAPTLSMGLFAVNANVTSLSTALNSGLTLTNATTANALIADIANYGQQAWKLTTSPATTDPGGTLLVRGTIAAADCDAGGTITVECFFIVP